jgi:ParB-like chromosome segregation protein Spo0J
MAMKYFSLQVEIRGLSDQEMADYAWSENEKRAGVTAIDQAIAIKVRMDDFGYTQEQVAQHMGLSRSAVANKLRLLKLPEEVTKAVQTGAISERAAIALLPLTEIPAETSERINQSTNSWQPKPANLIQEAIAGRLTDSDKVRQVVSSIVETSLRSLEGVSFVAFDFGVAEGIQSPICNSCPLVIKHKDGPLCNHAACFDRKGDLWQWRALQKAIEHTGLHPLSQELQKPGHYYGDEVDNLWNQELAWKFQSENHCPNLRLVYGGENRAYNKKFPGVQLVCEHGKGNKCKCHQAYDSAQKKAENAKKATGRKTLKSDIVEPTIDTVANAIANNNPSAWFAIYRLTEYNASRDESLTAAQIQRKLAVKIVDTYLPYNAEENVEKARDQVAEKLQEAGIPIPWSKNQDLDALNGLFLRIGKWFQTLAMEFPKREAVAGNLANLGRILNAPNMPEDFSTKCVAVQDILFQILNFYDEPGFQPWSKEDKDRLGDILRTNIDYAKRAINESSAQLCNYCLALIGSQEQRETIRKMLNARLLHLASLLDGQQDELPIDQTIPEL